MKYSIVELDIAGRTGYSQLLWAWCSGTGRTPQCWQIHSVQSPCGVRELKDKGNRHCRYFPGVASSDNQQVPGTTRDRSYGNCYWLGRKFTIVDTGGLVRNPKDKITEHIKKQALLAIEEAHVIFFLVDAQEVRHV